MEKNEKQINLCGAQGEINSFSLSSPTLSQDATPQCDLESIFRDKDKNLGNDLTVFRVWENKKSGTAIKQEDIDVPDSIGGVSDLIKGESIFGADNSSDSKAHDDGVQESHASVLHIRPCSDNDITRDRQAGQKKDKSVIRDELPNYSKETTPVKEEVTNLTDSVIKDEDLANFHTYTVCTADKFGNQQECNVTIPTMDCLEELEEALPAGRKTKSNIATRKAQSRKKPVCSVPLASTIQPKRKKATKDEKAVSQHTDLSLQKPVQEDFERPYKCDFCTSSFSQRRYLQMHTRIHTGEKPFKCEFCSSSFNQRSHLKLHIRLHTGEKPYKCDICDVRFHQHCHLKLHMRSHTGEKPYKCNMCEMAFAQGSQLKKHITLHTGEKPFKCEICGVGFTQRGHLQSHIITHSGEKPFECDICGERFTRASNLYVHSRKHTGVKPYKCEVCNTLFAHSSNLRAHQRKHTGEKPFKCDYCGESFSYNNYLKSHVRMHTGEKLYKCDICNADFVFRSNLASHKRTHTGEKPYKCDICGQKFSQSGNLRVHMNKHRGLKPYKCINCGLEYTYSSDLKKHRKKHANEVALLRQNAEEAEKLYKNDDCITGFPQRDSVNSLNKVHSGVIHECNICGLRFPWRCGLQRHRKMHIQESSENVAELQRSMV